MPRKVEMNPGEMFMVGDNVLLVRSYESVLGAVGKIGNNDNDRIAYFFTFTGKINNKERSGTYTVALSPVDALAFVNDVLHGLELLQQTIEEAHGG